MLKWYDGRTRIKQQTIVLINLFSLTFSECYHQCYKFELYPYLSITLIAPLRPNLIMRISTKRPLTQKRFFVTLLRSSHLWTSAVGQFRPLVRSPKRPLERRRYPVNCRSRTHHPRRASTSAVIYLCRYRPFLNAHSSDSYRCPPYVVLAYCGFGSSYTLNLHLLEVRVLSNCTIKATASFMNL